MSLSTRLFRLSILAFLGLLPAACFAQGKPQFVQPEVHQTGGRVTSFVPGSFQQPQQTSSPDLVYVNAFTATGTVYSVAAGILLVDQNHQFTGFIENQISFQNALGASVAVGDVDGDNRLDFAFAVSPTTGGPNLCVFYGTGATVQSITSSNSGTASFSGGYNYPSSIGKSGCTTFPTQPNPRILPIFSYIVAAPFKTNQLQQLIVEDTANGYIYVLSNKGEYGTNGVLPGFSVASAIIIPPADGPGPIYTGDFNNDGNTDFIVNNQTGNVATIYYGKGDGTFQPPVHLTFSPNFAVHSMLLQDMDVDHIPDLVVEGDNGVIEIFKGNNTTVNPFGPTSMGGTASAGNGFSGNGGHIAAIADVNNDNIPDILTTTPIGLSVLLGQGGQRYQFKDIYNIGPGRSLFSVADSDGDGHPDLYVDSPEGIAIVHGNAEGSFQTSHAYSAGQPALSATVADFNSDGKPDVAVTTGAVQAQILTGNGDGTFTTLSAPTSTPPNPSAIPANLWSTALTGDFDGDGCQDLLYSLTGLPLPTPGTTAGSGLYLQYGNKISGRCDGNFLPPQPIVNQTVGAPADNNFYGESAVGDLNGDGIDDIANLDTLYYDILLSQKAGGAFKLSTNIAEDNNNNAIEATELDSFSQVAAGFFTTGIKFKTQGRTNKQDLVFQDDANITPYLNNGDGTFTAMPALANPPGVGTFYGGTIIIADIDGDGFGDIIIPYQNLGAEPVNPTPGLANQLYIWYGHGDGTFDLPQITTLSRNYYLAQVVDMNNDGFPDVVLSDGYLVSILYNLGNHTFGNEQHFLAGQGINSISVYDVNNDGSLDLILANGGATISDAVAIGGKTQPSIHLTPNPGVNTGGITVLLNSIITQPVLGSIISSPNPSRYQEAFGIAVSLTATQTRAPIGGTVTFFIDGVQVGGPVPVIPGGGGPGIGYIANANWFIPNGNNFQGGVRQIEASYSGDAFNSPINLFTTQTITGSGTTTTLHLCVGPAPLCPNNTFVDPGYTAVLTMYYGQYFNGTTAAVANDFSALDPASTIAFNDAYNGGPSLTLCTLPVGKSTSCDPSVGTTIGTTPGINVFTAVYSGDATHTSSTSPTVTITVLQDSNNNPTLACTPNPSPQGQPVTCTATFTGNFAAPTGPVTFSNGSASLGTVNLVPGTSLSSTATFTTSTLPVGTDTITAAYAATLNFAAASATTNVTITPVIATTTKLTSTPNPSIFSQSVTLTATVSTATGTPVPTGTVTFALNGATLGTGTLVNGVATFTTTTLPPGSDTIIATASGDSATAPSSGTLVQIVNPLPPAGTVNFKITVTPSPITIGVGNALAVNVTVTPINGFSQPIALSCANLPNESTCTFNNAVVALSNGSTQLLISTMAPHNCGGTQPYFTGSNGLTPTSPLAPIAIPMLAGLAVIFIPGRRRWLRALIATVAIATAMQITGCGNCTDLGTQPKSYTLQIIGVASGTNEQESQYVTLNVTV